MKDDEFAYASASELALRVRRRDLSPVEIIEAAIARIERRNPSLNAFVHLAFDEARREAKKAEQAVMTGSDLGPLHGVPAAIKDLFDFKPGWPTTFGGVKALKGNIAQFYCPFAERIEKAGAILLGKTNAPVMGLRGVTDNYLFGATETRLTRRAIQEARRAAAPQPLPTECCPSRKGRMRAALSEFPPPGAVSMAIRRPTDASPSSFARMLLQVICRLFLRGPLHARSRMQHSR